MKIQKPKVKPPVSDRVKLLYDKLKKHLFNVSEESLYCRVRQSIQSYKDSVLEEMVKESIKAEQATWKYNGFIGLFSSNTLVKVAIVAQKNKAVRYVAGVTDSGQRVIAAFPSCNAHKEVADKIEGLIKEPIRFVRGGFLEFSGNLSKPKFLLSGESKFYGEADHKEVAKLLGEAGFEADVLE
ncbi:MAG: hypothetical protein QW035_00905 [Candidatus Anstonellales archaeon]